MKMKNQKRTINLLTVVLIIAGIFFSPAFPGHAQSDQGWTDPVNLSNSGSSSDPSLVIDSKGVIHVIWVDKFDGYKYVKSEDGVNWTSPVAVKFPFSPERDSRPVLLADAGGEIHALWRDARGALNHTRFLSSRFAQPTTWSGIIRLANSVADFEAVTSSRGIVHLGYIVNLGSDVEPAGVYYRRLLGGSWSSAKNLYVSQYFRSLEPADANVRLAVSKENDNVYMVWDDRSQKRIFMTRSANGGGAWEGVAQIKGPEDTSSLELPYNINIGIISNKPILLWQVGIPGGYNCTQYSQSALDEGNQFGPPVKFADELSACPQQVSFLTQNQDYSLILMNFQDDVSLIARNDTTWSRLQTPGELSTFINPVTFDNVLFGCQKASTYNEKLMVVGCDKGMGGDIWFRSNLLGSIEEWFPPPSAWTPPVVLTSVQQGITALSSIADGSNNVHAFWVQSPLSEVDTVDPTIQYARWNGAAWSNPRSIISGFKEMPGQLSVTADRQGRLFLSWVEGMNGDLYFSWARADRANIASEWSQPRQIPTPSELSSSPAILVDDSEKIAVIYSVPINEDRGIYFVQSDDFGRNWSQPASVMNAVELNWDSVDKPSISLSSDGWLHVLFTRYSLREDGRSEGLYYAQSTDGGVSWSEPRVVSSRRVVWSRIVYLNDQVLHRIWQEELGNEFAVFHQFSRDSGMTWDNSTMVSSLKGSPAKVALTTDEGGGIHIVQSYNEGSSVIVQSLSWDGSRWTPQENQQVRIKDDAFDYSIVTDVSSQGIVHVLMALTYKESIDGRENEVLGFRRSLGEFTDNQVSVPLLIAATPDLSSVPLLSDVQVTPTESSPLSNLVDVAPSSRRNIFGLLMVGVLTILILVFVLPGRKK